MNINVKKLLIRKYIYYRGGTSKLIAVAEKVCCPHALLGDLTVTSNGVLIARLVATPL